MTAPAKRRGRPPLAADEPTTTAKVRMPVSEWAACQAAAERSGASSAAEWARTVLLRAARREMRRGSTPTK